ncbi:hypothetical protein MRX96_004274 [Rhipicephalus microplus]
MASIHLHHETPGCCPIARQTASASRPLDALDASLLELGMLSAVTDSRRDYLLEKRGADSGPHPSGLCVLAMNSAYIADLSYVAAASSPPFGDGATAHPAAYSGPSQATVPAVRLPVAATVSGNAEDQRSSVSRREQVEPRQSVQVGSRNRPLQVTGRPPMGMRGHRHRGNSVAQDKQPAFRLGPRVALG